MIYVTKPMGKFANLFTVQQSVDDYRERVTLMFKLLCGFAEKQKLRTDYGHLHDLAMDLARIDRGKITRKKNRNK